MRAGKGSSSVPKRSKQSSLHEPPQYHAHIGTDAKGRCCFVGYNADGGSQAGSGGPFEVRVPSTPSSGGTGLVIEGMTGRNADPWPASAILAGARQGWFGFRLLDKDGSGVKE